ncbi:MAG: MarR family winged helix-turn-helix transcriptional regulator, partial [Marmoricola sp.]
MATTASSGTLWLSMVTLVRDNPFPREQTEQLLGMPFSRFRALRRIEQATRTQRELADLMRVDGSAMTAIVRDLVDRGLVTRTPSPQDRRCNLIEITPAGREAMDRVRESKLAPTMLDAL